MPQQALQHQDRKTHEAVGHEDPGATQWKGLSSSIATTAAELSDWDSGRRRRCLWPETRRGMRPRSCTGSG
ncbi:hypothetical protein WMY93_016863 [Mugilogobius chulae]|uniref:Uncharacterized protein n=1 Tax=Mugilogobius chulae TaxID=88201 RepID=A0AAW0NY78_9GOBI